MKYIVGIVIGAVLAVLAIAGLGQLGKNSEGTKGADSVTSQNRPSNAADFDGKGLTRVGPDIYNQTDTSELILSNNRLETLPTEMGRMTSLTVLKLDHNLLKGSLIGEVRKMTKLKVLDVSYNNMTGMPAEIGQLSNLETLDYSHNKITGLPNELAKLKGTLKSFDLSGNPLSQETITKLRSNLPSTTIVF